MSDQPDAADDAETQSLDRLERALDRIAACVMEFEGLASNPAGAEAPSAVELRDRLDRLVRKLRATLAAPRESGGN